MTTKLDNLSCWLDRLVGQVARLTITRTNDARGAAVGIGYMLPWQLYFSYFHADDGEWRMEGKKISIGARRVDGRFGIVIFLGSHRISTWIRKPNAEVSDGSKQNTQPKQDTPSRSED